MDTLTTSPTLSVIVIPQKITAENLQVKAEVAKLGADNPNANPPARNGRPY